MVLPNTVDHHCAGILKPPPSTLRKGHMQPTLQALASLQNALREALVQQDWAAIGALDAQCRALIGEAGASDPALREPLEELSRLYAELQRAARAERERI